jgi:hypothetical protein
MSRADLSCRFCNSFSHNKMSRTLLTGTLEGSSFREQLSNVDASSGTEPSYLYTTFAATTLEPAQWIDCQMVVAVAHHQPKDRMQIRPWLVRPCWLQASGSSSRQQQWLSQQGQLRSSPYLMIGT